MDLFLRNLNYLEKSFPELVENIQDLDINMSNYSIKPMLANLNNVILQNNNQVIPMYNETQLLDEIKRVQRDVSNCKNVIFFGLGLGYHIQGLVEQEHLKKIIIIETDIKNILLFLNLYDLEVFMENKKIELIFSNSLEDIMDKLASNFEYIFNDKVKVETFDFYKSVYKKEYLKFLELFTTYYSNNVISKNTFITFDKLFIENGILNYINHLEDSYIVSDLFNQFKGLPAIIVGAGPSLNNHLELLKGLSNKAVIFAVGSAINILDKEEIHHHFKVAIDPSEMEAKYFSELRNKDIDVIYAPSLNNQCLNTYTGKKYYHRLEVQPEYSYIEEILGIEANPISGGGTVSMSTVDIAYKLGCNPIILLGQDYSYTVENFYAKGAVNQEHVREYEIVKKDIYGNDVLTNHGLYALKIGFDDFIKSNFQQNNEVKIFNCSEAGLGIKGVENYKFEEIVSRYATTADLRLDKKDSLQKYKSKNGYTVSLGFSRLKTQLINIQGILEDILRVIGKMAETVSQGQNNSKILEYNQQLNKKVDNLYEYKAFYNWILTICEGRLFLVDDLFQKKFDYVEDETIIEQQRIFIEFMKLQYIEIIQMNRFILEVLSNSLDNQKL